MAHFSILGAGSWGTALGIMLAEQEEHTVRLWEFRPDAADTLSKERVNNEFLPGAAFPDNLEITSDLHHALTDADAILFVVPAQVLRSVLEQINPEWIQGKMLIGAAKGIEKNTHLRMSEVVKDVLGDECFANFLALSGPSHAEEVAKHIPTTVVIANPNIQLVEKAQKWFSCPVFRVYASQDIVGVELCGSLKNIIALATGICDGLGFGDNTRGALMTRGLHEMTRLGVALGGKRETFAGLSGMGDMITTCTSKHSRNRFVGEQLGLGRSLDEILEEMTMVAEGVATTRAGYELAQNLNVELPIVEKVHEILFEGMDAKQAVTELMTRSLKVEQHL
ncbi:glycerol-3-phosphate dehydrogenase [NAD(P)+] [bacterium BMS3Bbin04]|nr:glycerol-3-phosphate dehydrogenase [NAD(P)+] [bacterium BMS3Bbin04]